MQQVIVTLTHIGPYAVHPIRAEADLPNMPESQWAAFCESVSKYGLQKKILRFDKLILDGCQRCRACLETGRPPEFEEYQARGRNEAEIDAELRLIVKFSEFDRKHLPAGQLAAAALRLFDKDRRDRRGGAGNCA